jgi:hypothetical protein
MSTTNGTTKQSGLERCYAFMERILHIAQHEFPELSPPEIVFSLGLLQWRYQEQIEGFVREQYAREAARETPAPTDVN